MIGISSSQYLRHSEALIHPLLRVLWQLVLKTRIFGVQRSWLSWSRIVKGGRRVHTDLCCWREIDNLQRDKTKLVGIFFKQHTFHFEHCKKGRAQTTLQNLQHSWTVCKQWRWLREQQQEGSGMTAAWTHGLSICCHEFHNLYPIPHEDQYSWNNKKMMQTRQS